jgi:hypothetical protein
MGELVWLLSIPTQSIRKVKNLKVSPEGEGFRPIVATINRPAVPTVGSVGLLSAPDFTVFKTERSRFSTNYVWRKKQVLGVDPFGVASAFNVVFHF